MARVYRNISRPVLFLNMELIDLAIVFSALVISFVLTNSAVASLFLTAIVFAGIRYFKKGRAPGFFIHLVRFVTGQSKSGVSLDDRLPPYLRR